MTPYFVTGIDVNQGTRITAAAGDSVYVATNGVLASQNGTAIAAPDQDFYAVISGSVFGATYALSLGSSQNSDTMQVHIGTAGTVAGDGAIYIDSFSYQIFNAGLIDADNTAIAGTTFGGNCNIVNSGIISGDSGIVVSGTSDQSISNSGQIIGLYGTALRLGSGSDFVTNSGDIRGLIDLADGNDTYRATGAGTVDGLIYGGGGQDIFILGLAEEKIEGGVGIDRVVNSTAQGARMSLTDGAGTGVAAGDVFTGVEQLFGSIVGGDQLFGDGMTNWLLGRGGADLLSAGAGNDSLIGGAGIDTMIGGLGNDVFVFDNASEGGDVIVDFGSGDDVIRVSVAGFGAGLTAGALGLNRYWANTVGMAHDADDRFILQTTNKTLWFDPDGTGAAARVLVADLNDGAAFSAVDILVVA